MNFVSFSYAILFALVLAGRLTFGRKKTEAPYVALVILASALFYAWHVPSFLFILLTSALIDYVAGLYLSRGADDSAERPSERRRKLVLLASLVVNLGLLFFFKYSDFVLENLDRLAQLCGFHGGLPRLGLTLPMGISFYTFASLSYTIDVYRGRIAALRRFSSFFLFVGFFPHLVAGPIVRAAMFQPQMTRIRRLRLRIFNAGTFLIVRGFFLKMVCADNLSPAVDALWRQGVHAGADSRLTVLAVVLFAGQIFCDFEGYSSIAQGTAYLLGFRLPLNFDNPYLASSFRNFWERWHITLSQWLRDYLYIPLGGNRGSAARTCVNLMIVMLLGGLWHGAAFTFLAWGALHGAALVVERALGLNRAPEVAPAAVGIVPRVDPLRAAWRVVVPLVVLTTWVFFRSATLSDAGTFLANVVALRSTDSLWPHLGALPFLLPIVVMHARGALVEAGRVPACGPRERAVLAGAMLFAVLTCYGAGNVFIYFQF